jgi:hypothetical protein
MAPPATDGLPYPVCVLGMGRTGTSLTTRVIGLLGVDLGPEEKMLETAVQDNAKGYWEQRAVMELNDEILSLFGGTWWTPPRLDPGWEHDARLLPLAERAAALVADHFSDGPRWGWKDPRFSITLPFWRGAVGPMTYVICFRNPVEVAASLIRRDADVYTFEQSMTTWLRLSADALRHTEGQPRIVVFFEEWFEETDRQLARLADFIAPNVQARPEGWEEEARAFLEARLRHHAGSAAELAEDPRVPVEVSVFYLALRRAVASGDSGALETALPGLLDLSEHARATGARLERTERELGEATGRIAVLEAELRAHREWLDGMNGSVSWRITTPLRAAKRVLASGAQRAG